MPALLSETRSRRRAATPMASSVRRTRSAYQQSPLPRPSSRFIVSSSSSSSSSSNASLPPSPDSGDGATGRTRRSPVTTATQQSSSAVVEIYCWPDVRRHINNGGNGSGNDQIKVICPICSDELPVRGLEPSNELLQHEGGVVISCGHIFCYNCLERWSSENREEKCRLTCPMCRAKMDCHRCGAQERCIAIPKDHDDFEELPLTVPEGGEKASSCLRCEARDWWIWKVEHGSHGLPFRNVIESDFQKLMYHMMDRREDDRVRLGMVEMEQQLLVLFKENFARLFKERERRISQYIYGRTFGPENAPWQ